MSKVPGKVRGVLGALVEAYPNSASDKKLTAVCSYAQVAMSAVRDFLSREYGLSRDRVVTRVSEPEPGYILSKDAWAAIKGLKFSAYPPSWLLSEEDESVLDTLSEKYPNPAACSYVLAETGVVIDNYWYTAFRFRMRHAFPDDAVVLDMGDSVRLTDFAADKIVSALTEKV